MGTFHIRLGKLQEFNRFVFEAQFRAYENTDNDVDHGSCSNNSNSKKPFHSTKILHNTLSYGIIVHCYHENTGICL